jgi:membrane-associated phospholipid phosphatase
VRPRRSRSVRLRAGSALAATVVAATLVGVRGGRLDGLDRRLGARLALPRGAAVDQLMGVGTDLGSIYGLTGTCVALAATGRRQAAVEVAAAGAVAWCAAQAAKPLVGRERPYQADGAMRLVAEPAGSSWPSGHAAVAAAMADTLAARLDPAPRALARTAAGAVACSRLYVGVHHPTDVVAGAGIGVLSARAAGTLLRRWRERR